MALTYGDDPTASSYLTPEQEAAAQQAVDSLNSDYATAVVNVDSTTATIGAGNVKDAILANLAADKARIDQLAGDLLDQVRAGTLQWQKWIDVATVTRSDIAYQGGLSSDWSLTGVLKSTVVQTAQDVKTIAKVGLPIAALAGLGIVWLMYGRGR